jgi:hypothetical protein
MFWMKVARVVLILFAGGAATHCSTRTVVENPKLVIDVVGPDGKPVPSARVVVAHLSHPHSRFEGSQEYTAGPTGRVSTDEKLGSERIAPLCMHGVPQHFYVVCASGPGGSAYMQWNLDDKRQLELRLDPTLQPCNEEAMRGGRRVKPAGPDASAGQ